MLLAVTMVAAGWPGLAEYDSDEQFRQVLSGRYDDWHPPVMARLWSLLHVLGGGAGPMMVLQIALYWLGLGLLAGGLVRTGRPRTAALALAIGALPGFAVWQWAVLKDIQMVAAMLAAVGTVGWWRLRGVRMPWAATACAILLLGYATLVRANALFATVPLAVMLLPRGRWPVRLTLALVGLAAIIMLTPLIDADVLGATPSGVRTTEPLFDLAAIAVRTGDADATGIDQAGIAELRRDRCVKTYFWDTLGDGPCAEAVENLASRPVGAMYLQLAYAALRHPFAYTEHRLAHFNMTQRWLVGRGLMNDWPPSQSQPNTLGLGDPGPLASWWIVRTSPLADTPFGWPIVWLVLAGAALVEALRPAASPLRDLALALVVSTLALEASFIAISIAADLRYHLWSMIAAALGVILLAAEARPTRRMLIASIAALAVVIMGGIAARAILPPAPGGYAEMLAS
ncbi:MAG TPA: hypothetical protein VN137_07085 [Sphingomonas sp.]|nr:hypothetical protein [Sphingomonas sp.]